MLNEKEEDEKQPEIPLLEAATGESKKVLMPSIQDLGSLDSELRDQYNLEGDEVDVMKIKEEALQQNEDGNSGNSFLKIYKEDKSTLMNEDPEETSNEIMIQRDFEE